MSQKYKMTVDLNVLDHLGINLYSNIAAVITEAVANAWDADSTKVDIVVDEDHSVITIQDDGIGMTVNDMNEKYLRVGYRRREEGGGNGKVTLKGRVVMGRKGLGKLSLFSIAETIEVQSAKDGQAHGLKMTVAGIRESARSKAPFYSPEPLPAGKVVITQGTLIRLEAIKRQRLGRGVTALRQRLARRFSVIGESNGFQININGDPVTSDDRGDLPRVQFLWYFGNEEPDVSSANELQEKESLPSRLENWEENWSINGWIGTARWPKQLDSEYAGNLNSIVVFARGRLFHENILDKLNDGRLYTKYLTGQIEADFLDQDDAPDIATSDRQRLQEDDSRYVELISFLRKQMTRVEKRWTEWRKKHEIEKAKETTPALALWLKSLPVGYRDNAETLIAKLSSLPVDEEDDRKLMYKHGIMAFERMKLRGSSEDLVANLDNLDKLLGILADRDSIEATMYRDIVKSRLDVIKDFQKIVDDDTKEKVLQKYLFDHLWLLDPSWERATGSERIEETLKKEYKDFSLDLTEEQSKGRLDIRYKTSSGTHIIVELKRVRRVMTLPELLEQGQKYLSGLSKCLEKAGRKDQPIRIVFVLGHPVVEAGDIHLGATTYVQNTLQPLNARVVYYDEMIQNAQQSYAEYLEQSNELDKLDQIVDQL